MCSLFVGYLTAKVIFNLISNAILFSLFMFRSVKFVKLQPPGIVGVNISLIYYKNTKELTILCNKMIQW